MTKKPDDDKDDNKKQPPSSPLDWIVALGEQFKQIAEQAQATADDPDNPLNKLNGIMGFNIHSLFGGDVKVEPFGNVRRNAEGRATVHTVREPMVDVFEEEDHILVLVELPGVGQEHIKVELEEDLLFIEAANGDKRYRKEVLLSVVVPSSAMTHSCVNGVLQIRLTRTGS